MGQCALIRNSKVINGKPSRLIGSSSIVPINEGQKTRYNDNKASKHRQRETKKISPKLIIDEPNGNYIEVPSISASKSITDIRDFQDMQESRVNGQQYPDKLGNVAKLIDLDERGRKSSLDFYERKIQKMKALEVYDFNNNGII